MNSKFLERIVCASFALGMFQELSGQFSEVHPISAISTPLRDVRHVDMNGDGIKDLLMCDDASDVVSWLEGTGTIDYGQHHVIKNFDDNVTDVEYMDVEMDGDQDVLVCLADLAEIVILENNGGGRFTEFSRFSVPMPTPTSLRAADLDNNGSYDLIVIRPSSPGLVIFSNNGLGQFTVEVPNGQRSNEVVLLDQENDGDVDFLLGNVTGTKCFTNNGAFNFTSVSVVNPLYESFYPAVGDIDGDGYTDVIYALTDEDEVGWVKNLGGTGFGPMQTISQNLSEATYVDAADMDGDGDLDVVSDPQIADAEWYENDGTGTFIGVHPIDPDAGGIGAPIECLDVDMDGDNEVLMGIESWRFAVFENLGGGTLGPASVIVPQVGSPADMVSADVDNDGLVDLILTSWDQDEVVVFPAVVGGFGKPNTVSTPIDEPMSVFCSDLNGDGDADIVVLSKANGAVYMSFGDGTGVNWSAWSVVTVLNSANIPAKGCIAWADVEGDGDIDLVGGPFGASGFRIMVNDGQGGFTTASTTSGVFHGTRLADVDLDGDRDMFGWTTAGVFAKLNTANVAAPYTWNLSGQVAPGAHNVLMHDLNGDVYPDVVSGHDTDLRIYFNDGMGTMDSVVVLPTPVGTRLVQVVDIDGDGDVDIVAHINTDSCLFLYRNTGTGQFDPPIYIARTGSAFINSSVAFDPDADGELDIAWVGSHWDDVNWLEGFMAGSSGITGLVFFDMDQDGLPGPSDPPMLNIEVVAAPSEAIILSNGGGAFYMGADTGSYEVSAMATNAIWGTTVGVSPYLVEVTDSEPIADSLFFGYIALIDTTMVVPLFVSGGLRCNDTIHQFVRVINQGTTRPGGVLRARLDDLLTVVSFSLTPDSVNGQDHYWHFDSLDWFASAGVELLCVVPGADSIGVVAYAEVEFIALDSVGDVVGSYLSPTWEEEVRCAYDPNDKAVEPKGYGVYGAVPLSTEWLYYTVRFQNTGNDTAYDVLLRDRLSTELDRNSVEVLDASHTLTGVVLEPDQEMVFRFNGIMLPDSSTNEEASHGWLKFRIRPMAGMLSGTRIYNAVDIHFDLNPAITTNTTISTLVDCSLFSADLYVPEPDLLEATEGDGYQWFFNGDTIAGGTGRWLNIIAPGDYSVAVTNVFGCVSISPVYNIIAMNAPPSVACGLRVVPNPVTEWVRVRPICGSTTIRELHLFDIHGQLVRSLRGNEDNEWMMNVTGLRSGIYTVFAVLSDGNNVRQRLVIM